MPYVRVCIFVDGQSGRSVFDKDYQQAVLSGSAGSCGDNIARD